MISTRIFHRVQFDIQSTFREIDLYVTSLSELLEGKKSYGKVKFLSEKFIWVTSGEILITPKRE